jgi:hypothetical protein
MSETKQEEDHPINEDGLKVVGTPEDTNRFGVGDYVQVHLEMKDQVFLTHPHGELGIVVSLHHQDDEYYYHMPVIQFTDNLFMFNPDHLIVVQRADGTPGEVDALKRAEAKTKKEREKAEAEKAEKGT